MKKVHFVGIGGIGISALARYYHAHGVSVTGSDLASSEITRDLVRDGIPVRYGSRGSFVPARADLVVHSPAVPGKNPELREARRRGIPVASYPEAVGELTKQYETIAVAGSHGKSTTTALIGLALAAAGLDPTIIVGTKLREFGNRNFRFGKSRYLVLEADEWNRSFHSYYPKIVVITNVDKEHLDTYGTFVGVVNGFVHFLRNVQSGGVIVANGRDRGVRKVIANNANWFRNNANTIIWYNRHSFQKHQLQIPGAHNQVNAEAAWQAVKLLGVRKSVAERVFHAYRGAWRRLERLETRDKRQGTRATIYTDYAHHPTEIRATLQAVRERHPDRRIVVVFQPHHADRLRRLFGGFKTALSGADETVVLSAYRVLGRDKRDVADIAERLSHAIGVRSRFATDFREMFRMLQREFQDQRNVIIFMSAGDLDAAVRRFAAGKR